MFFSPKMAAHLLNNSQLLPFSCSLRLFFGENSRMHWYELSCLGVNSSRLLLVPDYYACCISDHWEGAGAASSNPVMTIPLTIQYPWTPAVMYSQFTPFSCLTSCVSSTSSTDHWINIWLIHGVQSGDIQIEIVDDICSLLELKPLFLMSWLSAIEFLMKALSILLMFYSSN